MCAGSLLRSAPSPYYRIARLRSGAAPAATRRHAAGPGTAITYFTEEDLPSIKPIANLIQAAGGDVPNFIRTTAKFERQPQRQKRRRAAATPAGGGD